MTHIGAMLKREIPPAELIAHARRHQHNFDELWVVEDLPYAGGISQATAVLSNTDRVIVGHGIALEFPPTTPLRVSLGVTGPRSLELAGAVSTGTVLPEGHGPVEIEAARAHLATGAATAGRAADDHHLTVFAAFHIGDPATMAVRNPEAPTYWEAIGDDPDAVASRLGTLIETGVDSIVLVSLGADIDSQLALAASEVLPVLRRAG